MDTFSALADPVRRSILQQLAVGGAVRVVDLSSGRDISRPAISRHLRVLAEAGLVRAEDVGRERHYKLDPAPLTAVTTFLESLEGSFLEGRRGSAPPVPAHTFDGLDLEVRRTGRERVAGEGAHEHVTPSETATNDTEESA